MSCLCACALNFIWWQGCAVWYIFEPQPCTQVMCALCIWNISIAVHAKIVAVRTVMLCTLAQYAIVHPEIYALGTQLTIVALGTVYLIKMCITKCASRNVHTISKQDACIPHPYNVHFVCIIEALDMCSMHFVYTGLNTPATLCSQDIHKRRTTNVFCVRSTSWQCARPFSNHDICNRHILHVVCNMFFCLGALFLSRRVCNMCTNVSWALPCARAQESPQSKLPMRRIAWID